MKHYHYLRECIRLEGFALHIPEGQNVHDFEFIVKDRSGFIERKNASPVFRCGNMQQASMLGKYIESS